MAEQYPDIAIALKQFSARAQSYKLAADYYAGNHRLLFATEKFRSVFGSLFRAFADNLCAKVVDAPASRLSITGFSVEKGGEKLANEVWALWLANRMDLRAGEVHTEALTSGDAYVIVWPDDDGQPIIYPNDAAMMTARYDSERPGVISWAAKAWLGDDGKLRLNLYYADRIEKYVSANKTDSLPDNSNGFTPYQPEGEGAWPLANPYGKVPVFHFANRGKIGAFGRSELADVIPLQDALNKSIADMLVAMEFVALPQRWATGLEVDIDPNTGKPKALFVPGADRLWTTAGTEAKFGQFAAADLSQFMAVQDGFRKEIASVTNTPIHFIEPPTGNWPSGESLKTAESEFLAKIAQRQTAFGNCWEDVMAFALTVAGKGSDVRLSAIWKDPAPHSELDQVNVAVLKAQIGVSNEQLQRELGYTEQEIATMAEQKQASDAVMADRLMAQFDRGEQVPGA